MYTIKGYCDSTGVSLQTPVDLGKEGVPVLVTFLSEDVKPLTSEKIVGSFKEKACSINIGLEPDKDYAHELMIEYNELFGYQDEPEEKGEKN